MKNFLCFQVPPKISLQISSRGALAVADALEAIAARGEAEDIADVPERLGPFVVRRRGSKYPAQRSRNGRGRQG
ncbi:MAG: hypothetical protein OXE94_03220 [Aestuariivita sp.]|nr:hypothetical protein [Aestuariivita sp.]MCY4289007.1 hypothetical protein [Aestuariivita sp.]